MTFVSWEDEVDITSNLLPTYFHPLPSSVSAPVVEEESPYIFGGKFAITDSTTVAGRAKHEESFFLRHLGRLALDQRCQTCDHLSARSSKTWI